jgi:hypothetical protein
MKFTMLLEGQAGRRVKRLHTKRPKRKVAGGELGFLEETPKGETGEGKISINKCGILRHSGDESKCVLAAGHGSYLVSASAR